MSLALSDTRVYGPHIRARLRTRRSASTSLALPVIHIRQLENTHTHTRTQTHTDTHSHTHKHTHTHSHAYKHTLFSTRQMCARNLKVWDLRCNGLTRNTSLSGVAAEASRSPVAPRAPEFDGFVPGTPPCTACHTFHTITGMYRECQGLRSVHGGVSGTNPSNSEGVQGYFGGGAYRITLLIKKRPPPKDQQMALGMALL